MRRFHLRRNAYHCETVNIEKLWSLIPETTREQYKNIKDQAPIIDVVEAGYFKVLGKGLMPKQPVIVRARYFSAEAERKIKEAGGVCELRA